MNFMSGIVWVRWRQRSSTPRGALPLHKGRTVFMDMVWLTVCSIDYQLGSTCHWFRDSLVLHMRPSQSLYTSLVSESIMLVTTWTSRCIPFPSAIAALVAWMRLIVAYWYVVYSLGYMFGISMSSKEPIYKLNKQNILLVHVLGGREQEMTWY